MKLASVIITTFKRPKYLKRAIKSVLNQTYNNFEVIVVDDNGLDNKYQLITEQTIQGYFDLPNFKYIKLKHNLGGSFARNEGVKHAKGDFIFFLDDDDEFLSNKLQEQIKILKENLTLDGSLSGFIRLNKDYQEIISDENFPRIGTLKEFILNGNFYTPMLAMKKSSFIKSGGFIDIPRFQDRFFMLHCLKYNMEFHTIKEPLYIMYDHTYDRITNQNFNKTSISLNKIMNFIKKYKSDFTHKEWEKILEKNYHIKANVLYNGNSYLKRLYSIYFWVKCYFKTKNSYYFVMIFKSFYPARQIKYIKNSYS